MKFKRLREKFPFTSENDLCWLCLICVKAHLNALKLWALHDIQFRFLLLAIRLIAECIIWWYFFSCDFSSKNSLADLLLCFQEHINTQIMHFLDWRSWLLRSCCELQSIIYLDGPLKQNIKPRHRDLLNPYLRSIDAIGFCGLIAPRRG